MKTATHAILFLILITFFASQSEAAEVYFEFGAYHYLKSDRLIERNQNFGGDTYSILETGVTFDLEPRWYFLRADEFSFALHHLSHPDRGYPANEHEEAWLNGVGIKVRWVLFDF